MTVLFLKDRIVNLSSHLKFSHDTAQIIGLSHLKTFIESKQCFLLNLNQQSVKLLIEQSQFACDKMLTILNYSTDKQDYMTILQVRKLCEYSNPEIAFEYSYEMRIFEHSNIR